MTRTEFMNKYKGRYLQARGENIKKILHFTENYLKLKLLFNSYDVDCVDDLVESIYSESTWFFLRIDEEAVYISNDEYFAIEACGNFLDMRDIQMTKAEMRTREINGLPQESLAEAKASIEKEVCEQMRKFAEQSIETRINDFTGLEITEKGNVALKRQPGEVLYVDMKIEDYMKLSVSEQKEVDEKARKKADMVNHPAHYNQGKYEVIDVIEDWDLGFCLGNAVKYIARAPHKDKELEDLKKAKWYLERRIKELEDGKDS